MSKSENILAFEAALKENRELLEKFEAAKKRIVENKEATNDAEILVKAAAEVDFSLTVAEVERSIAEMQELNEEDLEKIAGGVDSSFPGDVSYNIKDGCSSVYFCRSSFMR
jgi:hypothetical protein